MEQKAVMAVVTERLGRCFEEKTSTTILLQKWIKGSVLICKTNPFFFAMRPDVPRRILRVVRRYFKKPNEVQFEGCVLYFFGQDHGPLA